MVTDTTDVLPMMPKHLKKLPTQVKKLLTNVTYVLIVIFLAMDDDIIITSLATFMPKYAESQYQITPSTSALLVGGLTVVTACLGKPF
jgi:branched-subunit amino acid transport protein